MEKERTVSYILFGHWGEKGVKGDSQALDLHHDEKCHKVRKDSNTRKNLTKFSHGTIMLYDSLHEVNSVSTSTKHN